MQNSLNTLDLVERQFNEVALLLASGDAVGLAQSSLALKELMLELAQLAPLANGASSATGAKKAIRLRLKNLGAGVQVLRENLSRRAAFVDHAVRVLVPTPAPSTYSVGSTVYGTAMQQSGAFKVLAA